MGIAYRIDKNLGCTVVVWDGSITAEQHTEHVQRLAADMDWPPGTHLTDLTTVTDVTLPDPSLVELLIEGTGMRELVEKAIVVRPEFLRGSCIERSGQSRGGVPMPFSDLDRACEHLNLDKVSVRTTIDELREELAATTCSRTPGTRCRSLGAGGHVRRDPVDLDVAGG